MQPVGTQRGASLWKRSLAAGIDWVPFIVAAGLSVLIRRESRFRHRDLVWDLALRLLEGMYRILASSLFGQTVGQRVLGIRVVDANTGEPPALRQSALRWAMTSGPDALLQLVLRVRRSVRRADVV